MSKSIGNVVNPIDVIEQYGSDIFRYFCLKEGIFGNDVNYVPNHLEILVDSDLANNLGNLVRRATQLPSKFFEGKVPDCEVEVFFNIQDVIEKSKAEFEKFAIQGAVKVAIDYLAQANHWIGEKQPWKLKGEDKLELKKIYVRTILEAIYILTHFIYPFLPESALFIFNCLGKEPVKFNELSWNNLKAGSEINECPILFQRLDDNRFQKKLKQEQNPETNQETNHPEGGNKNQNKKKGGKNKNQQNNDGVDGAAAKRERQAKKKQKRKEELEKREREKLEKEKLGKENN